MVEAREELGEGFVLAANEHGEAAVFVGGDSGATDRVEDADGDRAILEEAGEVGQKLCDWVFVGGLLAYAATALRGFFAMCQGSSSSMRWMGWSLMQPSTWRR